MPNYLCLTQLLSDTPRGHARYANALETVNKIREIVGCRTTAFSCGARSALKLKERSYLKNMLSRRQLQGFVRRADGKDISSQI
jgi:hypothetical protein